MYLHTRVCIDRTWPHMATHTWTVLKRKRVTSCSMFWTDSTPFSGTGLCPLNMQFTSISLPPKRSLLLLIDVQYQWCFHPSHCFFSVCFYPLVSTNVNVAESMHSLVQVKSNMNGCVWEFNDGMGPTVYNKYLNPLPCVLCVNGCYTTVYLASILNQT